MQGNGIVFWGLFVVLIGIVVAYAAWMFWVERSLARHDPPAIVQDRVVPDSNQAAEGEGH